MAHGLRTANGKSARQQLMVTSWAVTLMYFPLRHASKELPGEKTNLPVQVLGESERNWTINNNSDSLKA